MLLDEIITVKKKDVEVFPLFYFYNFDLIIDFLMILDKMIKEF